MKYTFIVLAALAACGDEAINPVQLAGSGGSTAASGGAGTGGTPAVKRRIEQRNPFGNVAAADNLLWDGDFEWRATFASQYGWYASPSTQFAQLGLPPLEMGARCRSGIKCARLDRGWVILGLGVASERSLNISVWGKPEDALCNQVSVLLLSQSNSEAALEVPAESDAPAADGWCHYALLAPERASATFLFIQNAGSGQLIVDDAVITPAVEGQDVLPASLRIAPETVAAPIRAWARAATRPRIEPPSEERLRFEERMRTRKWTH